MRKFIYSVGTSDFEDTEPFGEAWKKAQALAKTLHFPIARKMIEEREEVYLEGGYFASIDTAPIEKIKIF